MSSKHQLFDLITVKL